MAPYTTAKDWQESVFIAFERGWIRIELPAPLAVDQPGRVTVYTDSGGTPGTLCPTLRPWHAMRCQAEHFLRAIHGEPTPLCRYKDGLKDLLFARQYIDAMNR